MFLKKRPQSFSYDTFTYEYFNPNYTLQSKEKKKEESSSILLGSFLNLTFFSYIFFSLGSLLLCN